MEIIYTVENVYINMREEEGDIITEVRLKLKKEVQFGEETQFTFGFCCWRDDAYKILFNFLNAFPSPDTELIIGEKVLRFEEDGIRKFKVLSTGKILNDVLKEE